MKRPLIYFALAIFTVAVFSCKKKKTEPEEETTTPPPQPLPTTYPDYSALKTGNYWIYELFEVSYDGSSQSLNKFDSSYVEKDTVIRNNTYHKVRRYDYSYNKPVYLYLRDSLHYIVTSGGAIVFSSQDFNTVFSKHYTTVNTSDTLPPDTICSISQKMDNRDETIVLPAGTFVTSDAKMTYNFYPPWNSAGPNPRYRHAKYAKGVGIVLETQEFYLSPVPYTEKRLVRYKIN